MSDELPPITDEIPENELEAEARHAFLVAEDGSVEDELHHDHSGHDHEHTHEDEEADDAPGA